MATTTDSNLRDQLRGILQGRLHLTRPNDAAPGAVFSPEARRVATVLAQRVIVPHTRKLFQTDEWKAAVREGKDHAFFNEWIAKLPLPTARPSDRLPNQGSRQVMALGVPAVIASLGAVGVEQLVSAAHRPLAFAAVGLTAVMACYGFLKSMLRDREAQLAQAYEADAGAAALVARFVDLTREVRFDRATGDVFCAAKHPGRPGQRVEEGHLCAALIYHLYCYNYALYTQFADENPDEWTQIARQVTADYASAAQAAAERKAAAKAEHQRQIAQQLAQVNARKGYVDFAAVAADDVAAAAAAAAGTHDHYPMGLVNPASGLPMVEGASYDVGGNQFGLHD